MRRAQVLFAASCALAAAAACSSAYDGADGVSSAGDAGSEAQAPPPAAGDAGADGAAPQPCSAVAPAQEDFVDLAAPAQNLVATATHLYWLTAGLVQRRPLASGPVETIWDPAKVPNKASPTAFVVAGSYVVAAMGGSSEAIPDQADAGISTSMGAVRPPLASNGIKAFGVNAAGYCIGVPPNFFGVLGSLPTAPLELAANTTDTAYALAPAEAGVETVVYRLLQAAPEIVFVAPGRHPTRLAVDGTELFMADTDTGDVFKASLAGGSTFTVLASGKIGLSDIAVRAKKVYYATSSGLRSVPAAGGCETALSDVPTGAFAVADVHVYYATGTKIRRAPIP